MVDWDADGPVLRANLQRLLEDVFRWVTHRDRISATLIKRWHRSMMTGLTAPDQKLVGRFRGESGLEREQVFVGARKGSDAKLVAGEVKACIERLQSVLNRLDALLPVGKALDRDSLQAVIEVSAWVHSEWVRIHPFGNGNGRVARTFTNAILMRYGLPPVLKLRPRPASPYGYAGAEGMARNTKPMESLLTQLLRALP